MVDQEEAAEVELHVWDGNVARGPERERERRGLAPPRRVGRQGRAALSDGGRRTADCGEDEGRRMCYGRVIYFGTEGVLEDEAKKGQSSNAFADRSGIRLLHAPPVLPGYLADSEFGTMVGDFGLPRMLVAVSAVAGSFSYMSPRVLLHEEGDGDGGGMDIRRCCPGAHHQQGGEHTGPWRNWRGRKRRKHNSK